MRRSFPMLFELHCLSLLETFLYCNGDCVLLSTVLDYLVHVRKDETESRRIFMKEIKAA